MVPGDLIAGEDAFALEAGVPERLKTYREGGEGNRFVLDSEGGDSELGGMLRWGGA